MNLRKEIDRLRDLEYRSMVESAATLGMGYLGYATDLKGAVYVGGCLALGFCACGFYNTNRRNELVKKLQVQERFGDGR